MTWERIQRLSTFAGMGLGAVYWFYRGIDWPGIVVIIIIAVFWLALWLKMGSEGL